MSPPRPERKKEKGGTRQAAIKHTGEGRKGSSRSGGRKKIALSREFLVREKRKKENPVFPAWGFKCRRGEGEKAGINVCLSIQYKERPESVDRQRNFCSPSCYSKKKKKGQIVLLADNTPVPGGENGKRNALRFRRFLKKNREQADGEEIKIPITLRKKKSMKATQQSAERGVRES